MVLLLPDSLVYLSRSHDLDMERAPAAGFCKERLDSHAMAVEELDLFLLAVRTPALPAVQEVRLIRMKPEKPGSALPLCLRLTLIRVPKPFGPSASQVKAHRFVLSQEVEWGWERHSCQLKAAACTPA